MTMMTSAFLLASFGAALPSIIRRCASALERFGRALLGAMHASRAREAARYLAQSRDLNADVNTVADVEPTPVREASAPDAADRRDELLAAGQCIPFQSVARPHHAPRIGGRTLGSRWRGAQ